MFADVLGMDGQTFLSVLGLIVGALGGVGYWIRITVTNTISGAATVAKDVIAEHRVFLRKMEDNDAKRIEVLQSMGLAIAQSKDRQENHSAVLSNIEKSCHNIETDLEIIKDRYATGDRPSGLRQALPQTTK